MREVIRLTVAVLVVMALTTSGCRGRSESECADGALLAAEGKFQAAFLAWQKSSLDQSRKEHLRASLVCIKREGFAGDDATAAQWTIARAREGVPIAQLYAGMLLASGAGMPQDLRAALLWLDKALANYPEDAAMMIEIVEQEAQRQETAPGL